MKTIHLLIKGKVQGVFYRASAKKIALTLDLKGWIKNSPTGCVECIATGIESHLNEFVSWCKQGPVNANVTEVIVTQRNQECFDKFTIEKS